MTREERRAIRRAQAVVRMRGLGWGDLAADLLLAHGCGPEDIAWSARRRLVEWAGQTRSATSRPGHGPAKNPTIPKDRT